MSEPVDEEYPFPLEDPKHKEQADSFKASLVNGLSRIQLIQGSYAFTKLSLASQQLERLYEPIQNYKRLQYLDLSENNLSEVNFLIALEELV